MGVDYGVDTATVAARKAAIAEREALIAEQAKRLPATDDVIDLENIRRACLDEAKKGPAEWTKNVEARARAAAITRRIVALKQGAEAKRLADGQAAAIAARLEAAKDAKLQVYIGNGGPPPAFEKLWAEGLRDKTILEMGEASTAAQAAALERKRREYSGAF